MRVSPERRNSYTQIVVNLSVPRTEIDSRTHACFASINFVQGSSLRYDHSLRSGKELHPLETAEGHFDAPPKSFRIKIPVKKASPHGQNGFLTKWNLILRLFPPLTTKFHLDGAICFTLLDFRPQLFWDIYSQAGDSNYDKK